MTFYAGLVLKDRAGYPASDLAHGERRVLELALALATAPQLLLLDEPMAGAGTKESQRMTEIIERLRGRCGNLVD